MKAWPRAAVKGPVGTRRVRARPESAILKPGWAPLYEAWPGTAMGGPGRDYRM